MGKYTYRGERAIEPSLSDIKKAEELLQEHYTDIAFGTPGQIAVKIEEVIAKAKWGWTNCKFPKDDSKAEVTDAFLHRVNRLLGPNSARQKKLKQARLKKEREELGKAAVGLDMTNRLAKRNVLLDIEEKAYMEERFVKYMDDFDFNDSSDIVLLNQIVVDEVMLHRLEIERLDRRKFKEQFDYENIIKEILERYRRNVDILGISRKQRNEADDSIQGNVAALSVNVEEKLGKIKELSDPKKKEKIIKDYLDKYAAVDEEELSDFINEMEMMRKHDMFPEKNFVSETELLGTGSVDAKEDVLNV